MKAPYMPYRNKCPVCQCEKGGLGYWYTTPNDPTVLRPAYQFAHTINTFACLECGAITSYEQIPVITNIWYPEEDEK